MRRTFTDATSSGAGGQSGPPAVKPYTLDDVVSTLNEVAPYDWRGFVRERIEQIEPRAPLGGIEANGWTLVYDETPNPVLAEYEKESEGQDWSFSLGLQIDKEGKIVDVVPGLPAAKAGMSPGMKLLGVNGRKWTPEAVKAALREAKTADGPIELLAENGELLRTYRADYHGGERYPHLERDAGKPDGLATVLKPLAGGQ